MSELEIMKKNQNVLIPLFKFILLQVRFSKLFQILFKLADTQKENISIPFKCKFLI